MAEQGLSSEDMRKQATINAVRRSAGIAAPLDPMDEAMKIAKQRSAISAMNQIAASGDTDALRATNERLEAEIARHQLEEKLNEIKRPEAASAGAEWQQWLMSQVQGLQEQLGEMRQEQNEAAQAVLQERLHLMAAELERLSNRPAEEPPIEAAKKQIESAMALVEYFRPPAPAKDVAPSPDHTSLELRAWEKRVEIDQERWRAERQDRHNERLAEIEADRLLREQQLAMDQRRSDQVERALTTTLPRLIDLGEQFMTRFMSAREAAVAPNVAAMTAEGQGATSDGVYVPPGCKVAPCQLNGCGYPIVYRQEWPSVQCPACGAQYTLTPDEIAPPEHVTQMAGRTAPAASYAWEQQASTQEAPEVAASANGPFV